MSGASLPTIFGILGLSVLLGIHVLAVAGRWRRAQWLRRTQALPQSGEGPSQRHIEQAGAAGRASDFLGRNLRRAYYAVALIGSVTLMALPSLPFAAETRIVLWLGLTALTFGSALILITYWQGWDEDLDRLLRKRLIEAEEKDLERRGLAVRDAATGAFTAEFWLHSLESLKGRSLHRSMPISCIVFEVGGLIEFGRIHSEGVAHQVLASLVSGMSSNLRGYDIVCRSGEGRIAVALMRCPARFVDSVASRLAINLTQLVLEGVNQGFGAHLALRWRAATLPGEALTPIQLMRVAELKLNQPGGRG